MTERSTITGREIPAGMSETTTDCAAGGAVAAVADVLGQVMTQMSAVLELEAGATPHVFAVALGVVVGSVVAKPAFGPEILAYAEDTDTLEQFADRLASQVRENVLLSAKQAAAHGAPRH